MKFILIPDSFKGTLSSAQICGIIKEKVDLHFPGAESVSVPVADGGEGSVDAFITAVGGTKVMVPVKGPYFEDIESYYGLIDNGNTAVIEMAAAAGLPMVEDRKNPKKTTTYGVGQLILAATESGVKKIIVGLGGSCTNDGGCGAAAAVGVKFYDKNGESFIPTGGTVIDIQRIDLNQKATILNQVEIVTMCDIDNPMYGPTGAAHVFAPQKGADEAMVLELDEDLECPLYLLCSYRIPKPEHVTHEFKKGQVYQIGRLELHTDDVVYLEEGSVVSGQFYSRMANRIRILGNGMLYGGNWHSWYENSGEQMIVTVLGDDIRMEGITVVDGGSWHVVPVASKNVVKSPMWCSGTVMWSTASMRAIRAAVC